ncbi:MAG: hypothetical protein RML36_11115 [Anaerolineae bacterium]|nr:carboxypeptidase-like regulatory domain-containing protein [Anaerolineae bacterium]MDW8100017.1 hypothetical protein [Anaerolineae bacterium]
MGNGQPINDAEAYGVRIVPVTVSPGSQLWRVTRVHHLTPQENGGRHHIFMDVLDENNRRIMGAKLRVTWQGGEQIVTVEKPLNEPGANFPMWRGQVCAVEAVGLPSDRVENLHTGHPDEAPGNTLFHHSFLVVFQRVTVPVTRAESVLAGRVRNGSGQTVLLMRDGTELARLLLGEDERFRFTGLAAGRYIVRVAGTNVASAPIALDGQNAVEIELTLPVIPGVIEGWVHRGAGRIVVALRGGSQEAGRATVARDESFRIEGLNPGTYVVAVEGTSVFSQPIVLTPGAVETLELTIPAEGETGARALLHYVLFGPAGTTGERTNFLLAAEYLARFRPAFGYSLTDASQAARVTIIGDGYEPSDEAVLLGAGCQVERISGGPDAVRTALAARIALGQP